MKLNELLILIALYKYAFFKNIKVLLTFHSLDDKSSFA